MLTAVIGVIVLLGGLIFFHELGHFSVAKFFGVRVEVFSLGFGKKLIKKTFGETEYCLSLFPLGGYVKLMGDDPYKEVPAAEAHRAFSTQQLYKRFLIVAAGPLANLLLAYILFIVVFWFGQPMTSSRIASVEVNSAAWTAGFRSQDRVVSINGKPIKSWRAMEALLKKEGPGSNVEFQVERGSAELIIPTTLSLVKSRNAYGEDVMVGGVEGISYLPLASRIGISDPDSIAYAAGLRSGDIVTKIGTQNIELYNEINQVLAEQWGQNTPITFTVKRPPEPLQTEIALEQWPEQSFSVTLPATQLAKETSTLTDRQAALGIFPAEVFVRKVSADSPAERGGLKAGDRIVQVGSQTVYHFNHIVKYVQEKGKAGEPAKIQIEREGKTQTLKLVPEETLQEDPITREKVKKFMVGFAPLSAFRAPEQIRLKIRAPGELLVRAMTETADLAERMVVSIGKLVMGKISVKNLGGPVLIASVAGKSLDAGLIPFLQMMALISINLFLLNLLPIPILDGGHLLFFTIEAIQRKPVSIRTMEIANQAGMVFILLLVVLTFVNDISRMVFN